LGLKLQPSAQPHKISCPCPAIQLISPLSPEQLVIVLLTIEDVVPQTAIKQVNPGASPERITPLIPEELIVPQTPVQLVIVIITQIRNIEDGDTVRGEVAWVIRCPYLIPMHVIIAITTEKFVTSATPDDLVIAPQSVNFISVAGGRYRTPHARIDVCLLRSREEGAVRGCREVT